MSIALIQSGGVVDGGGLSDISKAMGSNVTAGSALFVAISNYAIGPTNPHILTVSDNQGNSWNKIVEYKNPTGVFFGELWYALNAKAGATTITATKRQTNTWFITALAISEFSGVATSAAFDTYSTGNADFNTPPLQTSAIGLNGELMVAIGIQENGNGPTVGTGFSNLYTNSGNICFQYKVLTSATSAVFSGLSGTWKGSCIAATFLAASLTAFHGRGIGIGPLKQLTRV